MTSQQRAEFRKVSHSLHPLVTIGNLGLDQRIVKALDEELERREVVKVKFQAKKDDKRSISETLASETRSELIAIIGNIAIYYRDSEEHLYNYIFKK